MIGSLFEALNNGLSGAPVWALAAAALWGVASMLLSPCHLAGIPLIVGFINGQGLVSGRRAFALSSLFAIGILITIAVIGIITASLGRIAGDLGPWGNYLVAGIFLLAGLYLLGMLPSPWKSPASVPIAARGLWPALLLGLGFGIALGPCTFAYMAPVLSLSFSSAATAPVFAASLLAAFGLGHCLVIVAAGSASGMVQRYLAWNESSRTALRFRQVCGLLVSSTGLYLIWEAN